MASWQEGKRVRIGKDCGSNEVSLSERLMKMEQVFLPGLGNCPKASPVSSSHEQKTVDLIRRRLKKVMKEKKIIS